VRLVVTVSGAGLPKLTAALRQVSSPTMRKVYSRALNRTGKTAETRTVRAVAAQAGIPQRAVRSYGGIRDVPANPGRLEYQIVSTGGFIPTKHFGARQTRKGVSARPWGVRRVFTGGTFISAKLGGHVFHRTKSSRLPIKLHWGPAIPKEIVKDQSKAAFEGAVADTLPKRVDHELRRATKGAFS
jgi:hypothetical protein